MQAWASVGMVSDDGWQATLTRRLGVAVVVSLVLHVGILAAVGWIRLPRHGERPLASIEISLASLPTLQEKTVEPPKSQPIKQAVEPPKPVVQSKPVQQAKVIEPPKPVQQPKPIEQAQSTSPVKSVPAPLPPVPPPVVPAKPSNDLMRDIMKDIELPPDAPVRGDISPEDKPRKSPVIKLPDVPMGMEAKDATQKKLIATAQPSLTEDTAKELDEELKKIKKLEVPKAVPPAEVPSKPAPQVEAKAQSVKAVDTTIKVPGMAPGSNAYLALVRQRISNAWNAPPLDLTSHAYIVVVQFRLHKNGSVTGVTIEQSSGNEYYDLAGKRAVLSAHPLPVFPADVTDSYFDAHFTFTVGEPQG